jgi:hypothetical protein
MVAALAFALVLAGLPATAHAAWELPPTTLTPYIDGTTDVSVALDAAGNGIAVWGSRPDDGLGQNIWTSVRPAGGDWSGRALVAAGEYAVNPVIDADSAGNAVAAWLGHPVDQHPTIQVASRSGATGDWTAASDLGDSAHTQHDPTVAINDAGDAVVAWVRRDDSTGDAYVLASHRTGEDWGAPVVVSDPAGYSASQNVAPQVELDADGEAHVIWLATNETDGTFRVQEAGFDGTTWGDVHEIAASLNPIYGLEAASDGAGGIVAAWSVGNPQVIQAGFFSDGGWAVGDVTDDVVSWCTPATTVSAGANGTATVAWQAYSTGGVAAATGSAGGWGTPASVYTPPAGTYVARITLGQFPGRNPVVVWTTSSDDELYGAMGARLTATGWEDPARLAFAGGRGFSKPSVAMDPSGNVLAGWSVYQSYWAKVQVTGSPGIPAATPAAPASPQPPATAPLNPPFVKVRGGMFRMPRRGRVVRARLVNREAVPLRGTARLIHFYGRAHRSSPIRHIASQRRVQVKVKGRSILRLRLSDEAMKRLRMSPRHAYPVRLYLRLRAPDGRMVKTTTTFTLDGRARFGGGRRRPLARSAC